MFVESSEVLTMLARYLSVFLGSALKFVMGPITGIGSGLTVIETSLLTIGGMMFTVIVLSSIKPQQRRQLLQRISSRQRKLFTPRNRQLVRLWRRYGLWGVSLLTPVILSPIIGSLVAISFGEKQRRIIGVMLVSAVVWAFVFTISIRYMADIGRNFINP